MKCIVIRFLLLALTGLCAGLAQTVVPTSTLYLTSGDQQTLTIITGGTYGQTTLQQTGEYPIAVNQQVVTSGYNASRPGSVYDLAGSYQNPAGTVTVGGFSTFYDGTTDGVNNYAYNFSSGGVYQFGTDWSGGSLLFSFGTGGDYLGITYDASDNSLWVSGWNSNTVEHLSMTGTVLGSFTASVFSNSLTCLALDPADGTLWMGSQYQLGTLAQYTKGGVLLGTDNYGFTDNTLGGEFAFSQIPEPGVTTLFGLGLACLMVCRLRRVA